MQLEHKQSRRRSLKVPSLGKIAFWLVVAGVVAFILAPLVVAVLSSLTTTAYLKFPPEGFTLKWYSTALENITFVNSFLISIQLAVLTMVIAVGLGVPAAYAIATRQTPLSSFLEQLFLSPLMLPAIVFGVGFLFALSAAGYRGSFVGGLLAHIVIAVPFVMRSALSGFRTRDPRIEEASRSLGAGPIRTFVRIVLPLASGSIVSGAIFAFVISFDEAVVTLFLTGPGFETLPVAMFAHIQYANDPSVAALSTILVLFCVVLLVLMMKVTKNDDKD